ncbi:MAG: cation:H+ antiporter, partial [Thermoanaerobacterium sp.]|nr:cation:H+ antiporter [Thermoanaerobacterium sp.]
PPAILSLIITPIATELPEKLNSVLWIGQKKDTLALLNITGAMVFQSSVPVAIGLMFTEWHLTGLTILTTVLALISSYISLIYAARKKYLSPFILMGGSIFYCIFLLQLL